MARLEELLLFGRTKISLVRAQPEALPFIVEQLNKGSSGVMARQETLPFFSSKRRCNILGKIRFFFSKRPAAQPFFGRAENPVVMALPEALPFFFGEQIIQW
jgi:hypothetical protein